MDVETTNALEGLRSDVQAVRVDLRAEMQDLRSELRGETEQLRTEVREGLADNRRHAEILTESLRDDIRIVAEGVVALVAKVDALARRP